MEWHLRQFTSARRKTCLAASRVSLGHDLGGDFQHLGLARRRSVDGDVGRLAEEVREPLVAPADGIHVAEGDLGDFLRQLDGGQRFGQLFRPILAAEDGVDQGRRIVLCRSFRQHCRGLLRRRIQIKPGETGDGEHAHGNGRILGRDC